MLQITVWKSEFESTDEPPYQVSLDRGSNDDNPQILDAYATHQEAWDRAVQEADARQIPAVDDIDGDTYRP